MVFDWFFGPRRYSATRPREHDWSSIQPVLGGPELLPQPKVTTMTDVYSVGFTEDNRTVLKLTCQGTTTSLTMNSDGVRQMIRLLEATLPEDDDINEGTENV
jgi:hypothetical protein